MASRKTTVAAIGGGLAVIATLLTILASWNALSNDRGQLEVAAFAIEVPGKINANVYQAGFPGAVLQTVTLNDSVVDVTLKNGGNEGILITGIELVVRDYYFAENCDAKGSEVIISAQYDFDVPFNPPLPLKLAKGARNEVPANGFTRFAISVGTTEKQFKGNPELYAFDLYVKISGTDRPFRVGQGKVASNTFDLSSFAGRINAGREYAPDCARRNAAAIARIYDADGVASPELTKLFELTSADR